MVTYPENMLHDNVRDKILGKVTWISKICYVLGVMQQKVGLGIYSRLHGYLWVLSVGSIIWDQESQSKSIQSYSVRFTVVWKWLSVQPVWIFRITIQQILVVKRSLMESPFQGMPQLQCACYLTTGPTATLYTGPQFKLSPGRAGLCHLTMSHLLKWCGLRRLSPRDQMYPHTRKHKRGCCLTLEMSFD